MIPWWIWVAAGVAVALPAWRIAFRTLVLEVVGSYDKVDGFDLFMGLLLGAACAALLGPIILLVSFARRQTVWCPDTVDIARRFGGETPAQKQHRKAQELFERECRIAQLERELGIK